MNIMQISKTFLASGVSSHIIELSRILKERGHNVIVVSSDGPKVKDLQALGIKHYTVPFNTRNPLKMISNFFILLSIVRKEKIEIAHTHWRLTRIYLKLLSFFKKIQYVWTNHSNNLPTDFLRRYFTFYGKCAITVSTDMIHMLNKKLEIPMEKIKVIYNGVHSDNYYSYEDSKIKEIKEKYRIGDEKIITLLGRLDPVKGHNYLLNSLANFQEKNSCVNWKLIITGEETIENYKNSVIKKIKDLKMEDKVIFTGQVNPVDILNISNVLVLPSISEGFAIVCAEAFAMKVPVIRTKTGGYNDMKDYCYGVDYGDVDILSNLIAKVIKGGEKIESMKEKAYQFYKKELTSKIMVDRIERLYKEILEK